jgi:L-asparaginase II
MTNPILVEALRGTHVESFHRGAIAIVDAEGSVVAALGDIERPIFPRSAVKALQALPLVESGAAEQLKLTDEELALACASHQGEEAHVRTAASMLSKAGVDLDVLECGAHWPYLDTTSRAMAARGESPSALHNNCSGKHSGFVCVACMMAGSVELRQYVRSYVRPEHPVMREITSALQAATGFDLQRAPRATDGCSIPTFGIPLRHLAHAFARLGTGIGLSQGHARAARRLRAAVARAPFYVGGSARFDTRVMQRLGERVFCKVGAEGVYCAALPDRGVGVAIKMDDGNTARAAEVAMAAVIEARVLLDDAERSAIADLSRLRLRNWNGIEVGALQASDALRRL